jgi:NifU-like protein involved in Fe-S cluster formation
VDEAVVKAYRRLLRTGFEHAGSIEQPSVFLDTVREKVRICGRGGEYLQLFIRVSGDMIDDVTYLCTCDPTANVAVEILCSLIIGRPLVEAETVTEGSFCEWLGGESEELRAKAKGLLVLLHRGLARYRAEETGGIPSSTV